MRITIFILAICCVLSCQREHEVETTADSSLIRAIRNSSNDGTLEHFILPSSSDYASIPQDPANPLNDAKVQLGQMLFYETGMGLDPLYPEGEQTYSCGSCHLASAGFKPGSMQGIGDGGIGIGINGEGRLQNPTYQETELDVQGIRPLAVLNTAFVPNTLWNGQFGATHVNEGLEDIFGVHIVETAINKTGLSGLEAQNIEGVILHRMVINKEVMTELGYIDLFDQAFPDFEEGIRYSDTTAAFALSAFLRTQLANQAPFQDWLKGDYTALTESEKRGALVFFEKGNCATCHSETHLGSNRFFALGVNDMDMQPSYNRDPLSEKNFGRGGFTGKPEDYYKYKVPQLYNVGDNPFFFHGSSLTTLEQVVDFFDRAEPENPRVPERQIATQLKPLNLTNQEKSDLVDFLRDGLRDPNLERYVPEQVLSGNCIPNNDYRSKLDKGCN